MTRKVDYSRIFTNVPSRLDSDSSVRDRRDSTTPTFLAPKGISTKKPSEGKNLTTVDFGRGHEQVARGSDIAQIRSTLDILDDQGTYTPVLSSADPQPNLGADGSANGAWHRNGHRIAVWVEIVLSGTGISFGGSTWRVTLPFLADLSVHTSGALATPASHIGGGKIHTGTGQTNTGAELAVLLAADGFGGNVGKATIFYPPGSQTSIGGSGFATSARLLFSAQYLADPSGLSEIPT